VKLVDAGRRDAEPPLWAFDGVGGEADGSCSETGAAPGDVGDGAEGGAAGGAGTGAGSSAGGDGATGSGVGVG
jgi:hypothetical protein